MKLVTVVGARPQFIKSAPVSAALRRIGGGRIHEVVVHTGQHYDEELSGVFFGELALPTPDYDLGAGSGTHAFQTARMLEGVEGVCLDERPDALVVFGDTNSTLAGALAAAKLGIPVAHIEAGLRSYRRSMAEEINRVLTDHLATLLFCPTDAAVANLAREGVVDGVHLVGDVMLDALRIFSARARATDVLRRLELRPGDYVLATLHRAENTDDPARLQAILAGLGRVAERAPVVLPLHPRTEKALAVHRLEDDASGLRLVPPVSYLEMLALEMDAELICTDSGGVQKEAYLWGVPCVTLRDETEWVETVEVGANTLAGADPDRIATLAERQLETRPADWPPLYGDGKAAERITHSLLEALDG